MSGHARSLFACGTKSNLAARKSKQVTLKPSIKALASRGEQKKLVGTAALCTELGLSAYLVRLLVRNRRITCYRFNARNWKFDVSRVRQELGLPVPA